MAPVNFRVGTIARLMEKHALVYLVDTFSTNLVLECSMFVTRQWEGHHSCSL